MLAEMTTSGGDVVRPFGDEDDGLLRRHDETAAALIRRAGEMGVDLLDAEVLLDGGRAVLYHAGQDAEKLRAAVRALSHEFEMTLGTENLGKQEAKSSCGGCGTGCGSCGTVTGDDVRGYFAALRERMEDAPHRRVPLT
jgi:hypothetical protein